MSAAPTFSGTSFRPHAKAKITAVDLSPGKGLRRDGETWQCETSPVVFTSEITLPPGWYRFQLSVRSHTQFGAYKRAEITFHPAEPPLKPVAADSLSWNRTLDSHFMIELPRATKRLTITLFHAQGGFSIKRLSVARIPDSMVGLVAVAEKFRLLSAYRCLRPVLMRGGGMLLRGRFGEFGAKVLKGLRDSQVMRPGAYKTNEVDGGWWRRHALPEREAEAVRAAVDTLPYPEPLAILLPVNPKKFDEARAAAHSVRRQLYPHWELLLACAGPPWLHPHLAGIIGSDQRVKVCLVSEDDGIGAAVAQSLADTDCERVVVLPPSVELAEDALFHLAGQLRSDPSVVGCSGLVYDASAAEMRGESARTGEVWVTRTDRLPDQPPDELTEVALGEWVHSGLQSGLTQTLDRVVAYPVQEAPLYLRGRVGPATPPPSERLVLAADLNGITGWNHVAYALLCGLPSVGAKLYRHPIVYMDASLVPPDVIPPLADRRRGTDPELVVSPPFLAQRFQMTRRSAIFTMWETDTLPPADVATLNAAGLVIVPSEWQRQCFQRCGVKVPIEVAPLGYDPLLFHDDGTEPEVCTFGTAGALVAGGVRKNAQRMIDLFRKTFPTEQDVRLRVKISPTSPAVETYDDPRIDLLRATLPFPQLAGWYRSLTAYLNGSFGEGFGLHLIEAMACGRPVISANYSGLTAFFDPTVGYTVPHTLVPVSNDVYTGRWADPDDDGLMAKMREIYSDPAAALATGRRAAARATHFTWRKSGRKVLEVLRKHGLLSAKGGQA